MGVTGQALELLKVRCEDCGDDFYTRRWAAKLVCSRCEKMRERMAPALERGLITEGSKQGS
jgi:ribosomal protein L33